MSHNSKYRPSPPFRTNKTYIFPVQLVQFHFVIRYIKVTAANGHGSRLKTNEEKEEMRRQGKQFTFNTEKYGEILVSWNVVDGVAQAYIVVSDYTFKYTEEVSAVLNEVHLPSRKVFPPEFTMFKEVQHFVMDSENVYLRTIKRDLSKFKPSPITDPGHMDHKMQKDFETVRLDAPAFPNSTDEERSKLKVHDTIEDDTKAYSIPEFEASETLEAVMIRADLNDLQKTVIRMTFEDPNLSNTKIAETIGEGRKRVDRALHSARVKMGRYLRAYPEELKAITEGPVKDHYYNGNKKLGAVTGTDVNELLKQVFPYADEIYQAKNPQTYTNYKVVKFHVTDLKEKGGYTIYATRITKDGDLYGLRVIEEVNHHVTRQYETFKNTNSYEQII